MNSRGKVIVGIVIFLVVVLFPIWFSAIGGGGGTLDRKDLDPAQGDACVRGTDWMRTHHMELLDDWRDEVVREASRHDEISGREKSLTRTCLDCHRSREDFCQKCHDYAGVEPNCWECHNVPGGGQ